MEGVARQTYDKLGGAGVVAGIGQSNLVVDHAHVRTYVRKRGGNFNFWQLHCTLSLQVKGIVAAIALKFCIVIDLTLYYEQSIGSTIPHYSWTLVLKVKLCVIVLPGCFK